MNLIQYKHMHFFCLRWAERLPKEQVPPTRLDIEMRILRREEARASATLSSTGVSHRRVAGGRPAPVDGPHDPLLHGKLKAIARDAASTDGDGGEDLEDDDVEASDVDSLIEEADLMPRMVHLRPHGVRWIRFLSALETLLFELDAEDDVASMRHLSVAHE